MYAIRSYYEGRSFNISSGVAVSHWDIVRQTQDFVGRETGMTLGPGYFVNRGAPLDITRAREDLGFAPQFTDIQEGIADYAAWLEKHAKG